MSGRSSNERAGWLAFIVLVLTATVSLIACDESTSEVRPALAEAEPAQSMPADEPAAEPQEIDASERSQRGVEISQSEAAEGPESVEPEVEGTQATAVSASPPDDSEEQPSAEVAPKKIESDTAPPPAPGNGAGSSEADEPAQDAAAVEDEQPQPSELALVVPDRVGAVTLYAGRGIGWAVLATLEPGAPLTIIGRTPDPYGPKYVWFLAEMPDGTQGWLTADDLALDSDALGNLRELQPSEMEVITIAREGAWIRVQPYHTSPGCEMSAGGPMAVGGRSPDGEWSLVSFVQGWCEDSEEREYYSGWIHSADLEDDPMLGRAPLVYPNGLWLFPVDPQLEPTRLPVRVFDTYQSEAWSFDPEDGSLVFTGHCSSEDENPKRYTNAVMELTLLPVGCDARILVAPVGGTVLMMTSEGWESPTPFPLTLLDSDGRTEEIGYLHVYCGCDRGYLLELQARWSQDGQAIVVHDTPRPDQTDPEYSDFWLYHVATGERVDLRQGPAAAGLRLMDLQFHPDGQSIYVLASHSGPYSILQRLTLAGTAWPGFSPIESSHRYRISPRGDRIIAATDEKGRIFTDQGELLGERSGVLFHWFPDGDTIAYLTGEPMYDGDWTIEHLPSGRKTKIHLPSAPHWSPDGEHIAVMDTGMWWSDHATGFFGMHTLRMYDVSGELLSVHRFEGCYRHQWLPDGSQFALSVFPHCSAP